MDSFQWPLQDAPSLQEELRVRCVNKRYSSIGFPTMPCRVSCSLQACWVAENRTPPQAEESGLIAFVHAPPPPAVVDTNPPCSLCLTCNQLEVMRFLTVRRDCLALNFVSCHQGFQRWVGIAPLLLRSAEGCASIGE